MQYLTHEEQFQIILQRQHLTHDTKNLPHPILKSCFFPLEEKNVHYSSTVFTHVIIPGTLFFLMRKPFTKTSSL